MAYQEDFIQDDDTKNAQPTGQVLSSDNTSPVAQPGAGADSSAPASSASPQTGTGFTNLSTYVDANKEQSGDMANNITNGIQSGLDTAKTGLDDLSKNVNADVTKNTVTDNGYIDSLKQNPMSVTNPQSQAQYNSQTAGYQGPNSVNDYQPYQDLSDKYGKLDAQEKSLSDPFAIKQTLKDNYSRPSYTGGENTLDAFLTTSGAGADNLNKFKSGYDANNPYTNFQNTTTDLNSRLANAKATTNQTANDTTDAYNNAVANQKAIVQQQEAAAQQNQVKPLSQAELSARAANQKLNDTNIFEDPNAVSALRGATAPTSVSRKTTTSSSDPIIKAINAVPTVKAGTAVVNAVKKVNPFKKWS